MTEIIGTSEGYVNISTTLERFLIDIEPIAEEHTCVY